MNHEQIRHQGAKPTRPTTTPPTSRLPLADLLARLGVRATEPQDPPPPLPKYI